MRLLQDLLTEDIRSVLWAVAEGLGVFVLLLLLVVVVVALLAMWISYVNP
jgi:hypothetical protein